MKKYLISVLVFLCFVVLFGSGRLYAFKEELLYEINLDNFSENLKTTTISKVIVKVSPFREKQHHNAAIMTYYVHNRSIADVSLSLTIGPFGISIPVDQLNQQFQSQPVTLLGG